MKQTARSRDTSAVHRLIAGRGWAWHVPPAWMRPANQAGLLAYGGSTRLTWVFGG